MSHLRSADAVNIHYQLIEMKDGIEAPTVLFIHGLVMDNLSSWFFTVANPASQFARVIAYDLRGHGFSDRPKSGYGIEDHVSDLLRLIDSLSPNTPVILVGNSFGGLLALNFAARHPSRTQGLVLIDAQVNDEAWKRQMLASFGLQGEDRDRMVEDNFQNWLGRSSRRKSSRLAKTAEELLYHTSLVDDLRQAPLLSDEELRSIGVHAYAIYGAESDILPTAHRLEETMPHCHLQIMENCTHSVLWEETELVRSWILDSIATVGHVDRPVPNPLAVPPTASELGAH